mmetsp:Transcript_49516/g.97455  ORF Transcript_49516/g.97455 Transcript_49516/m.97455 type:complete len:273 (-) Transcript_49516:744-1562(-)
MHAPICIPFIAFFILLCIPTRTREHATFARPNFLSSRCFAYYALLCPLLTSLASGTSRPACLPEFQKASTGPQPHNLPENQHTLRAHRHSHKSRGVRTVPAPPDRKRQGVFSLLQIPSEAEESHGNLRENAQKNRTGPEKRRVRPLRGQQRSLHEDHVEENHRREPEDDPPIHRGSGRHRTHQQGRRVSPSPGKIAQSLFSLIDTPGRRHKIVSREQVTSSTSSVKHFFVQFQKSVRVKILNSQLIACSRRLTILNLCGKKKEMSLHLFRRF